MESSNSDTVEKTALELATERAEVAEAKVDQLTDQLSDAVKVADAAEKKYVKLKKLVDDKSVPRSDIMKPECFNKYPKKNVTRKCRVCGVAQACKGK